MELIFHRLIEIGIDVEGAISRLGGNEALYLSICRKFINDPNYHLILEAYEKNDLIFLEIRIHTLKGVAANLGFTKLVLICKALLDHVRNYDLEQLQVTVELLTKEYHLIIGILKEI